MCTNDKRYTKFVSRFVAFTTILSMTIAPFVNAEAINDTNITPEIIEETLMNVVLAADDADLEGIDIDVVREGLIYALNELGIDTDNAVKIHDGTNSINIATDIIWNTEFMNYNHGTSKFNVDGIGNLAISDGGKTVTMLGNQVLAGKNALYTIPEEDKQQKFKYSYEIEFGDSFNAGGILVRVSRHGDLLKGYMISINNESWRNYSGGYTGGIWEFEFQKGSNKTPFSMNGIQGSAIRLIKGFNIEKSGTLSIVASSRYITVSGGGLSEPVNVQVYYEEDLDGDGKKEIIEPTGPGFGFFSDHYEHNCEEIGKFEINDINVKEISNTYLKDLLNNLTWNEDGSLALIIDLSKYMNEDFSDPHVLGEMLARCLNEDIHYLSWGPDKQQKNSDAFIVDKDGEGMFIPLDDTPKTYDKSIDQTAQYIKEILDLKCSGRSGLPTNQDTFAVAQDMQIPVARIGITQNGVESNSYSNDGNLTDVGYGKGISEEKWEHKNLYNGEWQDGKPAEDGDYIVKLQVKDFSEQWSKPDVKYVTDDDSAPPIANFNSNGNNSYSPNGSQITDFEWNISQNGNHISTYKGSQMPVMSKAGTYEYSLQVTDSNGNKSKPFVNTIETPQIEINNKLENSLDRRRAEIEEKWMTILKTIWLAVAVAACVLGYEIVTYFMLDDIMYDVKRTKPKKK